jgi:nicotinamide mononucleotide transporter
MEKFEAWPVWFVVDAVYTFQFWHGGSYLTSVLYFIFVMLAIGGWKRWNRVSNLNKIDMK